MSLFSIVAMAGWFCLGWLVRDYRQFMTPVHPLIDEMDTACKGIKLKRKLIGDGVDISHVQVWNTRHGPFEVTIREAESADA